MEEEEETSTETIVEAILFEISLDAMLKLEFVATIMIVEQPETYWLEMKKRSVKTQLQANNEITNCCHQLCSL